MKNYIKLNKTMKNNKTNTTNVATATTKTARYTKVSTGVYMYAQKPTKTGKKLESKGTYKVVKVINGVKKVAYFNNKTLAIKFYKGL